MKQLDPKVVWLFFISFVLRLFIPIMFLVFWASPLLGLLFFSGVREQLTTGYGEEISLNFISVPVLLLIIAVFIILCFVWAKLSYHFYKYELTEAGFRKELGVIYKRYVTIPYDRIQNVDIYRGILARMLGLSDLNIQTAGSSVGVVAGEGRLIGVSKEVAEQLRDELIQRARNSKNQGL